MDCSGRESGTERKKNVFQQPTPQKSKTKFYFFIIMAVILAAGLWYLGSQNSTTPVAPTETSIPAK